MSASTTHTSTHLVPTRLFMQVLYGTHTNINIKINTYECFSYHSVWIQWYDEKTHTHTMMMAVQFSSILKSLLCRNNSSNTSSKRMCGVRMRNKRLSFICSCPFHHQRRHQRIFCPRFSRPLGYIRIFNFMKKW